RLLRSLDSLRHRGTRAHDLPIPFADLTRQDLDAALEPTPLERPLDGQENVIRIEGLGEEIVRSLLHGLDGEVDGPVASDDDDRHVLALLAQLPEDVQTASAWHDLIEQYQIRHRRLEPL